MRNIAPVIFKNYQIGGAIVNLNSAYIHNVQQYCLKD